MSAFPDPVQRALEEWQEALADKKEATAASSAATKRVAERQDALLAAMDEHGLEQLLLGGTQVLKVNRSLKLEK